MTESLDRPSWWLPFSVPVCFRSFLLPLFLCLARSRCLLNYSDLRFKRAQESVRPTPIWCIWKGEPASWAGPPPSTWRVGSGKPHASPDRLYLHDPLFFIPGSTHHSLPMSSEILHGFPNPSTRTKKWPIVVCPIRFHKFKQSPFVLSSAWRNEPRIADHKLWSSENSRHDKLTIQGRGVWQLRLDGWLAQEYAWEEIEIYSPLLPCTSELITWNSLKIYELALLIWKSSRPKRKFLVFSIIFKRLTQSEINRFYIWEFAWADRAHWKIINATVLIYYAATPAVSNA